MDYYEGCEQSDEVNTPRESLESLLTDLRHYCAKNGISFEQACAMSEQHYDAERNELLAGEPCRDPRTWEYPKDPAQAFIATERVESAEGASC